MHISRSLIIRSLLLWGFIVCPAFAATISGRVVAIADGDTLTVLDTVQHQHKIRLAEIDAPERKQDFGAKSRQSLVEICLQKAAVVETIGKDRYGRLIGKVSCAGVDSNAEQVRRGFAWVFVRYALPNSPLYELEVYARLRQLGLWAGKEPVSPWEWRAAQRAKTKK